MVENEAHPTYTGYSGCRFTPAFKLCLQAEATYSTVPVCVYCMQFCLKTLLRRHQHKAEHYLYKSEVHVFDACTSTQILQTLSECARHCATCHQPHGKLHFLMPRCMNASEQAAGWSLIDCGSINKRWADTLWPSWVNKHLQSLTLIHGLQIMPGQLTWHVEEIIQRTPW